MKTKYEKVSKQLGSYHTTAVHCEEPLPGPHVLVSRGSDLQLCLSDLLAGLQLLLTAEPALLHGLLQSSLGPGDAEDH